MKHKVKVTVLETTANAELQYGFLADPESGPCSCFNMGDVFEFQREAQRDDFYIFGRGCGITKDGQLADFPCAEARDCISCYVYAGLQDGLYGRRPLLFVGF